MRMYYSQMIQTKNSSLVMRHFRGYSTLSEWFLDELALLERSEEPIMIYLLQPRISLYLGLCFIMCDQYFLCLSIFTRFSPVVELFVSCSFKATDASSYMMLNILCWFIKILWYYYVYK